MSKWHVKIAKEMAAKVILRQSTNIDGEATMPVLHEMACAFAEEEFKLKGGVPFMWLMGAEDHVLWIETRWDSQVEKELMTRLIGATMQHFWITAYAFISEAWVTSSHIYPEAEKEKLTKRASRGLEHFPEQYRDDICMISSFNKDGDARMTQYKVTVRQPLGPNFLGPRIDLELDQHMEGRMWNLLRKGAKA
jgi:hypothetical protein